MQTVEILRGARELLSDPKRWIKEASALDGEGSDVYPQSPYAVCWCISGAIERVASPGSCAAAIELLEELIGEPSTRLNEPVVDFNDAPDRTHAEVLALLDRAIAKAEGAHD